MTTVSELQREFSDLVSDLEFGEDVVYVSGGTSYNIRAFVYRKGVVSSRMRFDMGSESSPMRYDVEIRISTHSTEGRPAIVLKGDYVNIAKDIGGRVLSMRVAEIIVQDPGSWRLGLAV